MEPFGGETFEHVMIILHATAGTVAVLLPAVNLLRRRKDRAHRWIGRSWVVAMYLLCTSGMFIYSMTGGFTLFHALALFTFVTTTLGVLAIRRGRVRAHVGNMVGSWLGAIGAGTAAALVPGRQITAWMIGTPATFWTVVALIVLATTAWTAWVLLRIGPRVRPAARVTA
ncbi:DUF2306 domain-containing protein [Microbacterium sediminis]|uniref:Uncharacterized protein n=1 Tax=Microbacterium sediminis TaxID=904291 RepID=A0A1B9NBE8_9MICO|nr:DUF2306 domain-containing protein [Microbacterium sediminis]OCG73920.1 hypothetical protein A7J15_06840 [Microbacterium sediminis]QBR74672.1 DUF2306 domain-containing protein [Microbacterium sediminis]